MRRQAKEPSAAASMRGAGRLAIAAALLLAALALAPGAALADVQPTLTTNAAEEVGVTTVRLSGGVNPHGAPSEPSVTAWRIDYRLQGEEGWREPPANAGTIEGIAAEESSPVEVSAEFGFGGELAPGQTYEFRIHAENAAGAANTPTPASFTMDEATEPLLAVEAADNIGYTTAILHGTLDPQGGNVNPLGGPLPIVWALEYRQAGAFPEPEEGWSQASPLGSSGEVSGSEAEESNPIPLEAEVPVGSLKPGTSYEARLHATYLNSRQASSPEPFEPFETLAAAAPTLGEVVVSNNTGTSAHFAATIDPDSPEPAGLTSEDEEAAFATSWHFECTPECPNLEGGSLPADNKADEVSSDTHGTETSPGLQPKTAYDVTLIASNGGGSSEATKAFTTPPIVPTVVTLPAKEIESTQARLPGRVNANNDQTEYWFQWGPEDCSANPCQSLPLAENADAGSGATAIGVSEVLTGLTPETTYHFRLLAKNSAGTAAGVDRSFTTQPVARACPNEARRAEQALSGILPDCRAWEMVSPPDKNGTDIMAASDRTHAAAGESPGLPAAVAYASLGGFTDVQGFGIATEYLSERDGKAGTSGWSAHAITPPQAPLPFRAVLSAAEPTYQADMSADLTQGVFKSWSPLTDAPDVAHVPNLYLREDLRTPGAGSYRLLSDSVLPLPAPSLFDDIRIQTAAASADYQHVLFETRMNLTADATGTNVKLYKSDGDVTRLLTASLGCSGANGARAKAPCSAAGRGAFAFKDTRRTLSSDGSRVLFTDPTTGLGDVLETQGAASKLFQLDDRGTPNTADDATIQIDASELAEPEPTRFAYFETASTDGSRVFFISPERLTENSTDGGLYMWERQPTDETQSLTVDATGGTFALTAHSQPSHGSGMLTNGSTSVTSVEGSFSVGQTISAPGIPPGTTIASIPSATQITLSAPATADGSEALDASVDTTTAPLPSDATTAQVQSAVEGLSNVGSGNVSVGGGPGGAGGAIPYALTFTGALAGVDVSQLTADGSELTGGAGTATVVTTTPVRNLTRIAPIPTNTNTVGVIGASRDGHRVYFADRGPQLVAGAPPLTDGGLYYWQDADSTVDGTLAFVGGLNNPGDLNANVNSSRWSSTPFVSRVTPDGRTLAFEVSDGSGLPQGYDQTHCAGGTLGNPNNSGGGCSQVYIYRADGSTPTVPDVACASCNPSGAPATDSAFVNMRSGSGGSVPSSHLSHALSDDGRRVFFSTTEALVPQDTNGSSDAYEYDVPSGTLHLISSGTDPSDSFFLDASADGHDVYFLTRQPLIGWDTDNAYDLYDARVAGGFPEPPPTAAACEGESCRTAAAASPKPSQIGSGIEGTGNPRSRHCPRGRHRLSRHGKTRCVKTKPHRRSHRRAASANRGVRK